VPVGSLVAVVTQAQPAVDRWFCVSQIVSYVNMNAVDASVQQLSLSILENMVPTSRLLFELVKKEVTLDRLLTHLQV